jgi:hypothetical protein
VARDWESTFSDWTGRASDAEQSRYEWTRDEIREALGSPALASRSFDVYAKGSYPNFTNVVRDSDVDIAVELTDIIRNQFSHRAEGMTMEDFGLSRYRGDYSLSRFKDEVEQALIDRFGSGPVERGKKAIHIRESQRGLAADVVPCQTHRQYISPQGRYRQGIRLLNDANPGERIVNYPKHHLDKGVNKNDATSRRYKRVVRILKRLENEMVERSVIGEVPSFLVESAVFNVPNGRFNHSSWTARIRATLAYVFNGTMNAECVASTDWMEANNIKYLFHSSQNWTHQQAHEFASEAWGYIGFD